MVSSPHPLATRVGVEVLRQGGSAVDAAVAVNAALAVLLPDQCGLGGDLFALVYDPAQPENPVVGLNGSGCAPRGASVAAYRQQGCASIPQTGPLSVTAPGTVRSWELLNQRWGRLPLGDLLEPARRFARDGFEVNAPLSHSIEFCGAALSASAAARVFQPRGRGLQPGEWLAQPELAQTILLLQQEGSRPFYHGVIAEAICQETCALGGYLRMEDLAAFSPEWVEPISTSYHGLRVYTVPPNSRGVILLDMLDRLAEVDLRGAAYQSPEYIRCMVGAAQEAIAAWENRLGDPRFTPFGWPQAAAPAAGQARVDLKGDTVALCVVDGEGMGVTMIQSVYHDFGSVVYIPKGGFFLQNRGASFNMEEGHPNCLEPGKRPVHTLMPALATRAGRLRLAFGTRGGAGQPQTLAQVLTGILEYGMDAQQAVEAPRWVYGSTTSVRRSDGLILESRIPAETLQTLRAQGIEAQSTDPLSVSWMGCAQAVWVDEQNGVLYGGADPRGGGLAEGL